MNKNFLTAVSQNVLFVIVFLGIVLAMFLIAYLFEKAAKKGLIEAQNNLGNMYYFGQGVKQDYKKAKEYFGKACDGGNQIACINYKKLNP